MTIDPIEEMRLSIQRAITRISLTIKDNPRSGSLVDRNIASIKALDQLYIDIGSMADNSGLGKIANDHKKVNSDLRTEREEYRRLYFDVNITVAAIGELIRKQYFELSKPQNEITAPINSEHIPDYKLRLNRYFKKNLGRILD